MSRSLSPGPSITWPEELTTLRTPSGVFYPQYPSRRPPLRESGNRHSRVREFNACNLGPSVPEPRSPMVNVNTRDIAARNTEPLYFKTPSTDAPISRLNATWTPLTPWGPTRPRHPGISLIANPRCKCSLRLKTPNADPVILRIRATCPSDDRRLPLNREIATRDFDVHVILALANPDMPIFDGKQVLSCTCELTPSQLLRDLTVCGIS
jgi:hypothetical protein